MIPPTEFEEKTAISNDPIKKSKLKMSQSLSYFDNISIVFRNDFSYRVRSDNDNGTCC